jgi:hypothetical protein
MLLNLAGVNEHAVLCCLKQAMERSTFSEVNSVPFAYGGRFLAT